MTDEQKKLDRLLDRACDHVDIALKNLSSSIKQAAVGHVRSECQTAQLFRKAGRA